MKQSDTFREIPVSKIRENPNNPRSEIGSVEDLKASINANGLLQNIVRENMTAVDEANAVAKLFAQGKSRTEIGAMFGKSARWAEGRRKIVELGDKAMKLLAAVKHESELNKENNELYEQLFSTFNGLASCKFAERLKEKRRKNLEALSKQRFKEAVNLNAKSKDE